MNSTLSATKHRKPHFAPGDLVHLIDDRGHALGLRGLVTAAVASAYSEEDSLAITLFASGRTLQTSSLFWRRFGHFWRIEPVKGVVRIEVIHPTEAQKERAAKASATHKRLEAHRLKVRQAREENHEPPL